MPPLDAYEALMPTFEKYVRKIVKDDFEASPLGNRPRGCTVYTEDNDGSIVICRTPERDGQRCIKATDAPSLMHSFMPHFVYAPSHYSGRTTVRFDLRLGPGSQMLHQWRGYPGDPYYFTGPSFSVRDGKLYADTSRESLASVPENRWIHVEVAAKNSSEAGARWQLKITCPGEDPKTFTLPVKDGNRYRETTWVGFLSDGDRKSEWWLDNLEISNAP